MFIMISYILRYNVRNAGVVCFPSIKCASKQTSFLCSRLYKVETSAVGQMTVSDGGSHNPERPHSEQILVLWLTYRSSKSVLPDCRTMNTIMYDLHISFIWEDNVEITKGQLQTNCIVLSMYSLFRKFWIGWCQIGWCQTRLNSVSPWKSSATMVQSRTDNVVLAESLRSSMNCPADMW